MQIVVLDGGTLNPGDLDRTALASLGELQVRDRTAPGDVVPLARDASALLVNKVPLPAEVIRALPKLRYVGVLATGYDRVDVVAAKAHDVVVTNVPAYGTESVAQAVFALLLELVSHTGAHAAGVRAGRWSESDDFCYWDAPLVELAGLTIGIVGYGAIGRAVGRIARGFGMNVLAAASGPASATPADGVPRLPLDDLLPRSDVVTLHVPLTAATSRLFDAERIARMRREAYLINTARGGLIDAEALARALREGRLAGAGLDVLEVEPPPSDHPLLRAPRCVVTPHVAWATTAARRRLIAAAASNLRAFLEGRAENVVG
jgi:glycerate dehydrogenase